MLGWSLRIPWQANTMVTLAPRNDLNLDHSEFSSNTQPYPLGNRTKTPMSVISEAVLGTACLDG